MRYARTQRTARGGHAGPLGRRASRHAAIDSRDQPGPAGTGDLRTKVEPCLLASSSSRNGESEYARDAEALSIRTGRISL
jgi:hypothetical protein